MFRISFTLFLFFVGCTSGTKTREREGSVAAKNLPADSTYILVDSSKTTLPEKEFRGFYITRERISTFRDCNTNQIYQVEDQSGQLQNAYLKSKGNLSYPYESAYTEVKGFLKRRSDSDYASEPSKVLVVTGLKEVKQKSFQTQCYDFDFIALGNEPFWSAEIIPAENVIAIKDVSAGKAHIFPYTKAVIAANNTTYSVVNDQGDSLNIMITKENCNDGMSDRNYYYSAQVDLNSKHMSGCAIRRGDKL